MTYVCTMVEKKKTPGGRRENPNYKQLNLNIEPELIKKLRIKAVERDLNLSEMAEIIFKEWLANND